MEPIVKRVRIEVSTSVKGIHSYSATVEWTGDSVTWETVKDESDALIAVLDAKYPTVEA